LLWLRHLRTPSKYFYKRTFVTMGPGRSAGDDIKSVSQLSPASKVSCPLTIIKMSDTIYLRDIRERPGFLTVWERLRHQKAHWFVELFAESASPFLSFRNNLLNPIAVAGCLSLLVIHTLLHWLKYDSRVINLL
jgi:hypothetical protein